MEGTIRMIAIVTGISEVAEGFPPTVAPGDDLGKVLGNTARDHFFRIILAASPKTPMMVWNSQRLGMARPIILRNMIEVRSLLKSG